jgi:hypothetical protein
MHLGGIDPYREGKGENFMSEIPPRRRQTILFEVNYLLKVPGFAEPFRSKDMRYNPESNILLIKAPDVIPFYETDSMRVETLDLEVPAIMRQGLANSGWLEMAMSEFISILRLMYSVED